LPSLDCIGFEHSIISNPCIELQNIKKLTILSHILYISIRPCNSLVSFSGLDLVFQEKR